MEEIVLKKCLSICDTLEQHLRYIRTASKVHQNIYDIWYIRTAFKVN